MRNPLLMYCCSGVGAWIILFLPKFFQRGGSLTSYKSFCWHVVCPSDMSSRPLLVIFFFLRGFLFPCHDFLLEYIGGKYKLERCIWIIMNCKKRGRKKRTPPKKSLLDFFLREPELLWHSVIFFTVFFTCLDCIPGYLQIYESLDRHSPAIAAILSPPKLSFSSKQSVLFTHQPPPSHHCFAELARLSCKTHFVQSAASRESNAERKELRMWIGIERNGLNLQIWKHYGMEIKCNLLFFLLMLHFFNRMPIRSQEQILQPPSSPSWQSDKILRAAPRAPAHKTIGQESCSLAPALPFRKNKKVLTCDRA